MIKYLAAFILCCGAAFANTPQPIAAETTVDHIFQLTSIDVEKAISTALTDKSDGKKMSASLIGYVPSKPLFSHKAPIMVEIRGLTFDTATQRWNASVMAVSEDNTVVSALPVNGRFEEIMDVVVLKKQIRAGETISADDVDIRSFPVARMRAETITDPKEVVGQSPKRTISASRPIRLHEIARPTLVEKNRIVQMRYGSAGLEITTTGQAMENGGKGELIAVKNLSSKKIVHAVVDSASVVLIPTLTSTAGQSASIPSGERYAAN